MAQKPTGEKVVSTSKTNPITKQVVSKVLPLVIVDGKLVADTESRVTQ